MIRAGFLAFLLSATGCLAISPLDGALSCSPGGHECPSGYYCATASNTCFRDGHSDDGSAPAGADMSGSGGDMVTATCVLPTDCPPAPSCFQQECVKGECGLVATNSGTALPPALQTPNDCQELQCDGAGNTMTVPDPTDVPLDPTGGCNTTSCNGAAQVLTPTASGTACTETAKGICNGAGVCGVCKPGTTQCSSTTEQQLCTSAGTWMNNMTCSGTCSAGVCTGTCNATNYANTCVGTTLQTCSSNNIVGNSCQYACCSGACTGTCTPNTNTCASTTSVTSCSSCGVPTTTACGGATPYCNAGKCVSCQPGAQRCCADGNAADSQTCAADGSGWSACAPCQAKAGATFTCGTATTTTITCGCTTTVNACASYGCGAATNACGQEQDCGDCGGGNAVCTNHQCKCIGLCM